MTMSTRTKISKQLVHQKSKAILADILHLRSLVRGTPRDTLLLDEEKCTVAERRLERIINRAIDINFHLIRALDVPPPNDYTESFRALGRLGILPVKLANAIAPAAGARNILIHGYDDLDDTQFYSSLKDALRLFPRYIAAVERFIDQGEK